MRIVKVSTPIFKRAQIRLATKMSEWCKSAGLTHLVDYDYMLYSVNNNDYQPGSDVGIITFRFFNGHEVTSDGFIAVWGGV